MAEPHLRIYDNTQVASHKNCERKFFFRHILDLEPEYLAPAPAFGLAWHKGMDFIWRHLSANHAQSDEFLLKGAYKAWESEWTRWGFPALGFIDSDEWKTILKDRYTPSVALEMFAAYIMERRRFITIDCELLGIERPFAVPLTPDDPNLFYAGRLDKIIRWQDGIYVIDHKTTSLYKKDGYFRSDFIDSFSPNSQMDGYAYGAWMEYGEEFKGVLVDAALVHKDVHDGFRLVPVKRKVEQLDAWLWETRQEVERLELNTKRVQTIIDSKDLGMPYLAAFRKNPDRCFDFFTPCAYLDLCKGYANPLTQIIAEGTPMGFRVEPWSPFDVIQLEQLGFKKEEVIS